MMEYEDEEPPSLYSQNVLRVAKAEKVKKQLEHGDLFCALENLKHSASLNACIREIGFHRFFFFFLTPVQIAVYKSMSQKFIMTLAIEAW